MALPLLARNFLICGNSYMKSFPYSHIPWLDSERVIKNPSRSVFNVSTKSPHHSMYAMVDISDKVGSASFSEQTVAASWLSTEALALRTFHEILWCSEKHFRDLTFRMIGALPVQLVLFACTPPPCYCLPVGFVCPEVAAQLPASCNCLAVLVPTCWTCP